MLPLAPRHVIFVRHWIVHTTHVKAAKKHARCLQALVSRLQTVVQQGIHIARVLEIIERQGKRTWRSHSSLLKREGFGPPVMEGPACVQVWRFNDIAKREEEDEQ